mmetsp:Transcript_5652/g.15816  ORF Transcript_5652/g.15816 Transcript_5652/m.15816 type:complete len:286 (+) Transcript_5652:136-993(+)
MSDSPSSFSSSSSSSDSSSASDGSPPPAHRGDRPARRKERPERKRSRGTDSGWRSLSPRTESGRESASKGRSALRHDDEGRRKRLRGDEDRDSGRDKRELDHHEVRREHRHSPKRRGADERRRMYGSRIPPRKTADGRDRDHDSRGGHSSCDYDSRTPRESHPADEGSRRLDVDDQWRRDYKRCGPDRRHRDRETGRSRTPLGQRSHDREPLPPPPPRPETRDCFKCGKPGHLARDCPDSTGIHSRKLLDTHPASPPLSPPSSPLFPFPPPFISPAPFSRLPPSL